MWLKLNLENHFPKPCRQAFIQAPSKHESQLGVPLLHRLWIAYACPEKGALREIKVNNIWEHGATLFAMQYVYLIRYGFVSWSKWENQGLSTLQLHNPSIYAFSYEELLSSASDCLRDILSIIDVQVPETYEVTECMSKDSQARKLLQFTNLHFLTQALA